MEKNNTVLALVFRKGGFLLVVLCNKPRWCLLVFSPYPTCNHDSVSQSAQSRIVAPLVACICNDCSGIRLYTGTVGRLYRCTGHGDSIQVGCHSSGCELVHVVASKGNGHHRTTKGLKMERSMEEM